VSASPPLVSSTGSISEHFAPADRAFAVVLSTDLVGSTKHVAEMGDRRWRELLEVHHGACGRQIEQHRGRLVKYMGDGVLAVFDAPARAVRCGYAILGNAHQLGCEAYAGVHAGEASCGTPARMRALTGFDPEASSTHDDGIGVQSTYPLV